MRHTSVGLLCLRLLIVACFLPSLVPGCGSPNVTTPTQAGGSANRQQTGGVSWNTPVQVTPQINVATSSQPATVAQPTNSPSILPP
jgi:hypothetical protein